jgi:hypothetical protein
MRNRITKNTDKPWTPALAEAQRRGLHVRDDEDEDEHEVAADDLLAARTRREKLQKADAHPETVAEARREEEAAEHAYRRTLPGYHSETLAAEDEDEEDQGETEVSKALSGLYTNAVDLTVQKSQDSELVSGIRDRRQRLSKRHLAQFDSAYADPEARRQIEAIRKAELGIR